MDWPTDLLMPSDKRNSIMGIATCLISSLFNVPEMCLFANCSSSNAHIMVLPKLTFVLLCTPFSYPLSRRLWFSLCALWLQCETWTSAALAGGIPYVILCLDIYPKSLKWLETKCSDTVEWLGSTPTFWSITGHGVCLDDWIFLIFRNGWIICRNAFSIYNTVK